MDFTFESHQLAFRDAIRKFLVVEAAPEMLRDIWETQSGRSAELRAKQAARRGETAALGDAENDDKGAEVSVMLFCLCVYHARPSTCVYMCL